MSKSEVTPTQLKVLQLTADGKTSDEAAAILKVTPGAVRAHVHRMKDKLGASTAAGLVARAFRSKLIV